MACCCTSAGARKVVDAATGCGARLSGISLAASMGTILYSEFTGQASAGRPAQLSHVARIVRADDLPNVAGPGLERLALLLDVLVDVIGLPQLAADGMPDHPLSDLGADPEARQP